MNPATPPLLFFQDESGKAGSAYLDPQQRFSISAGWLMHRDSQPVVERLVRRHFKLQAKQKEVKGSRLLKQAGGAGKILAFVRALLAEQIAIPFYTCMDRRLSATGKIVDVLFDPEFNPEASDLPMSAIVPRRKLANYLLLTLSPQTLSDFVAAYRNPSSDRLISVIRRMKQGMEKADAVSPVAEVDVTQLLDGAADNIETILKHEDLGENHRREISIGVPAFAHCLRLVDQSVESGVLGATRAAVVHDEISGMDEVLNKSFAALRSPIGQAWSSLLSAGAIRPGLSNIEGLTFGKSAELPALQAADVLASVVGFSFKLAERFATAYESAQDTHEALFQMGRVSDAQAELISLVLGMWAVSEQPVNCGAYVAEPIEQASAFVWREMLLRTMRRREST